MTTTNSRRDLVVGLRAIAIFALAVLVLFSLPFTIATLGSARGILVVAVIAAVLAIVSALIALLMAALFRRKIRFHRFAFVAGLIWFAVGMIAIATPVVAGQVINATQPLLVPRVTLTDGKKTVVYQGMVHVASKPFYESVIYDMVRAADNGYIFFYEGVGPGSEANKKRFAELLGTGNADINGIYNTMSNVCGLSFQGEFFKVFSDDMKNHPERHKVADVTMDDMIAEWDRLVQADPNLARSMPAPAASTRAQADSASTDASTAGVVDFYKQLSEGQRNVVGILCKAFMNSRLGATQTDGTPFNRLVILDFRNHHLTDAILNATSNKIYITYGAGHLPGVYQLLKQRNPAWRIADVTWLTVIQSQSEREGVLNLEP